MEDPPETNHLPHSVATVSKGVLDEFFEELAKTEGFKEVAANLKKVVIDDGVFAEPAVRTAIFPEII